ncbi:MAG TPA: tRNA uridine-5-carboxymethylaminomethyl(34) synthesis GTPase MnmE [Steroidobacteraceae bacterium]|nr:tRNA uridine-5-carboxymethylaminomethyl(34) synthesis GTPase MnmE [Steroidobacteraceae bacterium]
MNDTIAAIATAAGRGGIGIVRVSGPACRDVAVAVLGRVPAPRVAELHTFRDESGQAIDAGLALFFPAPHSYTGEDVLELQGHGGAVVLDLLLRRTLSAGARAAGPGEFTQRAFLNEKLDLAQAEAISDLIESGSAQAARSALRSLLGEFSTQVHELSERVLEARMWVEAAIDFPEEEIDFLGDRALGERLEHIRGRFTELAEAAHQGSLLRDGLTLVIAGRPNAGKSSLLNRLAGYEAAIVTEVPGTTRDVLRERIEIDGLPLHVLDTAGLREASDAVEAEGVRRARHEISRADRVLYIVDSSDASALGAIEADLATLPVGVPRTLVFNKIDRSGTRARVEEGEPARVYLCAATGEGLAGLRAHLLRCVGFHPIAGGALSARTRHLEAMRRAREHVDAADRLLRERRAGELVAQELRDAQRDLGEITGEVTSEELLGRIFGSFCVGK